MNQTLSESPTLELSKPKDSVRLGEKKLQEINRGKDLIEALGWASLVAVVVMFLINGGLQNLSDLGSILYAITRLTALIATNLLLIDILLVARVSWLDRYYGHDRVTQAHKKLGKPILYLVITHVIASVWQSSITDNSNVIDQFFSMITNIPDLLTSAFAFAFMILVVVTSLNFARKAIPYEAWYFLHLFAYGAVLLAIPHQFSLGIDVAGKDIATYYWIAMYVFVLGNIAWFRIAKPLLRALSSRLRVSKIERTSSDSVSVYLSGKNMKRYSAEAGQFFLFRPLTPTQWFKPHPFSMSAASNGNSVRFTIGSRGDDTEEIQGIQVGTPVMLEGPYGIFTESRRTKKDVVLIASGIGIPPVRALAESMFARPEDITIIYRVRDENDAALIDETRELARIRGFKLEVLSGKRGQPNSWMSASSTPATDLDRLLEIAPNVKESDVYVCGPTAWTRAVERTLNRAGTPKQHVHTEEYAW